MKNDVFQLWNMFFFSVLSGQDSGKKDGSNTEKSLVMKIPIFMGETLTDNLNLYKLVQYIEKSKIAHKLQSFSQKFEGSIKIHREPSDRAKSEKLKSSTSAFLSRMANSDKKSPEQGIAMFHF